MLRRLISTHNVDRIDIRCYNCHKCKTVSGKENLPDDWSFMYWDAQGVLQTIYRAWQWVYQDTRNLFCSLKCFEEYHNIW